jgi:hypothetical protein
MKQAVYMDDSEPNAGTNFNVSEVRLEVATVSRTWFGMEAIAAPVAAVVCIRLTRTLQG